MLHVESQGSLVPALRTTRLRAASSSISGTSQRRFYILCSASHRQPILQQRSRARRQAYAVPPAGNHGESSACLATTGARFRSSWGSGVSCSSWRTTSSWHRPGCKWVNSDRNPKTAPRDKDCPACRAEENAPFELSHRELLWQRRMEEIQDLIRKDPYEALFGSSNRRLGSLIPRSMLNSSWFQHGHNGGLFHMLDTVYSSLASNAAEMKKEKGKSEGAKEPTTGNAAKTTTQLDSSSSVIHGRGVWSASGSHGSNSFAVSAELQYDPITMRMVPKVMNYEEKQANATIDKVKAISASAPSKPTADAVDIPGKKHEGSGTGMLSARHLTILQNNTAKHVAGGDTPNDPKLSGRHSTMLENTVAKHEPGGHNQKDLKKEKQILTPSVSLTEHGLNASEVKGLPVNRNSTTPVKTHKPGMEEQDMLKAKEALEQSWMKEVKAMKIRASDVENGSAGPEIAAINASERPAHSLPTVKAESDPKPMTGGVVDTSSQFTAARQPISTAPPAQYWSIEGKKAFISMFRKKTPLKHMDYMQLNSHKTALLQYLSSKQGKQPKKVKSSADRRLEEEVEAQKLAMAAFENKWSSRKLEPSQVGNIQVANVSERSSEKAARNESLQQSSVKTSQERNPQDLELVREVRQIYENAYGPITAEHRQAKVDEELQESLQAYELKLGSNAYTFKSDRDCSQPPAQAVVNCGSRHLPTSQAIGASSSARTQQTPTCTSTTDAAPNTNSWTIDKMIEGLTAAITQRESLPEKSLNRGKEAERLYLKKINTAKKAADEQMCCEEMRAREAASEQKYQEETIRQQEAAQEQKYYEEMRAREAAGERQLQEEMIARKEATHERKSQHQSKPSLDPALYRVLAYDPVDQSILTAKASSSFSPPTAEPVMLLPDALARLHAPAKFLPHLTKHYDEGYEIVSANRNLLVLKRVQKASEVMSNHGYVNCDEADSVKRTQRAVSDAVAGFALPVRETLPVDTHALLEEAKNSQTTADISKTSELSSTKINPVDGTASRPPPTQTGNFASPTGFVNHDVFTTSAESFRPPPPGFSKRVRKEEPVFSGSPRIPSSTPDEWFRFPPSRAFSERFGLDKARGKSRKEQRKAEGRRERFSKSVRKVVLIGAWTAACCYATGVVVEYFRNGPSGGHGGRFGSSVHGPGVGEERLMRGSWGEGGAAALSGQLARETVTKDEAERKDLTRAISNLAVLTAVPLFMVWIAKKVMN